MAFTISSVHGDRNLKQELTKEPAVRAEGNNGREPAWAEELDYEVGPE